MLYIEDECLSPRNLSPVFLDLSKGHKSDGDAEAPPTPSKVSKPIVLDAVAPSHPLAGKQTHCGRCLGALPPPRR